MRQVFRRDFLRAAGAAALLGVTRHTPRVAAAMRPNIVLVMVDDMGFSDIGCYGGEIDTPNLNRLAETGLRFTQFYNNAKCQPTRASLMTGKFSQHANKGFRSVADALHETGYRTLMAGKWHLQDKPVDHGFDRHFGLLDGACNFFNPGHARPGEMEPARKFEDQEHRWAIEDQEFQPYTPPEKDFYTTDAFTTYAVDRLKEYAAEDKPFFLYVAYNAPHYPMHAWPEDIAKYRGKYLGGWEKLRQDRFRRQQELGLFGPDTVPAERDPDQPRWEDIEDKDAWDLKMAVYAAMIDRVDQNIGRILDTLEAIGKRENTLFLFLADNGGSSEHFNSRPEFPPGVMEGFHTVGAPWANASNTPFRRYKTWNHEGGICTPLIANWPGVVKRETITTQLGHVIDILPTCLDVAGAPAEPVDGKSLLPILRGEQREGHEAMFWQHGKCRAIHQGNWKLTGVGTTWELYDLDTDRTERHDLSKDHPERVQQMSALWDTWAKRVGASIPK